VIAFSRPFWPLFLHVLGAMTLVGAVLAAAIVSSVAVPFVAQRRADLAILRRAAFLSLAVAGIPSYVVMRVGAQWIYSREGYSGKHDPTWLGIGFGVADAGLLILLVTSGLAYWWLRSGKAVVGRIVAGLSTLYLLLLAVAWMAMSGKWG
jgi:hypothetical protein